MYLETIFNVAKAIKSKALSSVEITEAMLVRIKEVDSHSSAYITVTAERTLAQAKKSEAEIIAGQWRGLLHGVPIGLKDIINTDFAKTTAGTEFTATTVPPIAQLLSNVWKLKAQSRWAN